MHERDDFLDSLSVLDRADDRPTARAFERSRSGVRTLGYRLPDGVAVRRNPDRKHSMDLILWRHAEAESGEPDHGRRLTAKGIQQAERMAQWLDHQLPATTRVLTSPADRAQQTVLALKRKFRVVPELGPGASPAMLLAAVGWPESREPVLVVGHQPTLGAVAALLLSGAEAPWSLRKCNAWWLSNRVRNGEATVLLKAVVGPGFV